MKDKFATAFDNADILYVMDVFPASEMPIPGISGKTVATGVMRYGDVKEVYYVPNRRTLLRQLVERSQPGDLIITQGAGDVTLMGPALLSALNARLKPNG